MGSKAGIWKCRVWPEGWQCLQPGLFAERNFAARAKTELLKSIKKKKKTREKRQQEKNPA